jgi:hypothetical protein
MRSQHHFKSPAAAQCALAEGDVPSNYLPSLHRAKAAEEKGVSRRHSEDILPSIFPSSSLSDRRKQSEYEGVFQFCFMKKRRRRARGWSFDEN